MSKYVTFSLSVFISNKCYTSVFHLPYSYFFLSWCRPWVEKRSVFNWILSNLKWISLLYSFNPLQSSMKGISPLSTNMRNIRPRWPNNFTKPFEKMLMFKASQVDYCSLKSKKIKIKITVYILYFYISNSTYMWMYIIHSHIYI